jgi:hypothetical protein
MAICSWCANEYDVPAVFHVCPDKTTFADRLRKSSEDLAEQRANRDRWKDGSKMMGDVVPSSQAIVPATDAGLPKQPNTVARWFEWNSNDLYVAKKLKIKI